MKYVFDFGLTEPIHCEQDTADRLNVEFKFGKYKEQTTIEGFKITVETDDEKEAASIAKKTADKLTDLLSATSGTFSEWILHGMSSNDGRVSKVLQLSYSIRNNTVLNFSDDVLKKILGDEHSLNKRLGCLRNARRAERTKDWKSVISYLNDEVQAKNEPLRHLRNLLTHSDNPQGKTLDGIRKHYPDTSNDGIKLVGDTFDPRDTHNEEAIERHARRFLNDAHAAIRSDTTNTN